MPTGNGAGPEKLDHGGALGVGGGSPKGRGCEHGRAGCGVPCSKQCLASQNARLWSLAELRCERWMRRGRFDAGRGRDAIVAAGARLICVHDVDATTWSRQTARRQTTRRQMTEEQNERSRKEWEATIQERVGESLATAEMGQAARAASQGSSQLIKLGVLVMAPKWRAEIGKEISMRRGVAPKTFLAAGPLCRPRTGTVALARRAGAFVCSACALYPYSVRSTDIYHM